VTSVREDPVVGRSTQLSTLDSVLADVHRGAGRAVWLDGDPGVGKSALVDVLVARADALGWTTLWARGDRLAQPFPLRLAADCLRPRPDSPDPARARLAQLILGPTGIGVLDPVLAATELILELVDRLCARSPTLLAMDDIHWADQASLGVWGRLCATVGQLPLLLVGAGRSTPGPAPPAVLRRAVADRGDPVVQLGPLAEPAVVELARQLLAAPPGPRLLEALAGLAGNPLHIREYVAGLVRDDLVERAAGHAELHARVVGPPASLPALIDQRLDSVRPAVRGLLRLAALFGPEFGAAELAIVADRPAASLVAPLDEAVAVGVLVAGRDDRLGFSSAVIRAALAEEFTPPVRAALHQQFARRLAGSGAPPDVVGRHLLAGPTEVEDWAVRWLAERPEGWLRSAPAVTVELLERVVARPVAEPAAQAALATTLFWLGHDDRAGAVAADAVRCSTDAAVKGRLQLYRVRGASRLGRYDAAATIADEALADDALGAGWRARIRAWRAIVLGQSGRREQGRREAWGALAQGQLGPDAMACGYAELLLSTLVTGDAALAHLERGQEGLDHADDADRDALELRVSLRTRRLDLLPDLGRPADFGVALNQTLIFALRVGSGRTPQIQAGAALALYDLGAWDDALAQLESLPPNDIEAGTRVVRHGLAALIAGRRQDWPGLRRHRAAVAAVADEDLTGHLLVAQAIEAEATGDAARALHTLEPVLDRPAGQRHRWLPQLVRLALAAGDETVVRRGLCLAEADAGRRDATPRQVLAARFSRGLVDQDAAALLEVAEAYRRHGWAPAHACALEEAAVRLALVGDVEAARAALTDAARRFDALGAGWDLRRAEERLRAHDVRRASRPADPTPASGWAALSPTELRVAELVAGGLANPDIAAALDLPRPTVAAHVSRVLAKLQVRARIDVVVPGAYRAA
jgi:DNA-binding CsgD family transcriptional regulator